MNTNQEDEQFIVSMTSHPGRINHVRKALDSILNQETTVPYKVVLVLAEPQFPGKVIPYQITELEWDKQIEIIWHPTDIRSHKKLNPTLQKYPDATIIITDDDVIRPSWWLQMFVDDHSLFPDDVIVGMSAWRLQRNFKQTTATDFSVNDFKLKCVNQPHKILYTERPANGLGGVLYPKHTFKDSRFFDEELFMNLSPYSDESWQYCFNVIEGKTLRMCSKPIDWLNEKYAIKECSGTALCIHNTQNEYTRLYNLLMDEFPEYKTNMIERFDLYDNIKTPAEQKEQKQQSVEKSESKSQSQNNIKQICSEDSSIYVINSKNNAINNVISDINIDTKKITEIKKDVKPCVVCQLTGRLGNIIFKIAAARYYAKQHDMPVKFYYLKDLKTDIEYFENCSLNKILKEPVTLTSKYDAFSNSFPILEAKEEGSIIYTEIPYMKDYNIHITGNRQSEKYFTKQFVIDMFDFSKIDKEIDRMYAAFGDLSQIAALHIRQTDYVYPKRHYQTLEEQDVLKIREKFPDDKFIIFSDNIEWCKQKFEKYGFLFPPKNDSEFDNSIVEFCALRKFMAIIMSNSAFSWWGSYLNMRPNHWTVYKEPWFTDTIKQDIIPNDKNWMTLEKFLDMG